MKRNILAGVIVILLIVGFFIGGYVLSNRKALGSIVLNGTVYSYGEGYQDNTRMFTGAIVSTDLDSDNPSITVAASPLSLRFPIDRTKIPLDLKSKQTLFVEHTEERQTSFLWKAFEKESLKKILKYGTPVTAQFNGNNNIPFVVYIHEYTQSH